MDDKEANEKRLIASEIILQLWRNGKTHELELLLVMLRRAKLVSPGDYDNEH